jgi:hypothetical protein
MVAYGLKAGAKKEPWVVDTWTVKLVKEADDWDFYTVEGLIDQLEEYYEWTGEHVWVQWYEIVNNFINKYPEITAEQIRSRTGKKPEVYILAFIVEWAEDTDAPWLRIQALTTVSGSRTITLVDINEWLKAHNIPPYWTD